MAGMGASGFTPVHTALIPELGMPFGKKGLLMENLNPALNVLQSREQDKDKEREKMSGFDGFADMNIFTLKSLDAYVPLSLFPFPLA
jgi:bZIP-type transcription factor MBZ1